MATKLLLSAFACVLLVFLRIQTHAAEGKSEGRKIYLTYCSGCHGESGKGDGPAAKSLPVKPANHTDVAVMNQLSDKFLFDIISKGGSAVGKSAAMPAWGSQLKEKQIREVVAYLRTLSSSGGHSGK
ncbi:MAG: cytochrome c [Deltaproteobacteria bacterium]|nr:cytochrome c [Deltaproteobacteria bacterium]